jgi:hypothetical protein
MNLPILHIVDPAMTTHMGHHREINMAIARGMRARGYEVRLWVNKTYKLSAQDQSTQGIRVTPYFSINPYAIFNADGVTDLIQRYGLAEDAFANEIASLQLTGMLHIPNVFAYQLKGLSQAQKCTHISACVHHHPSRYSEHGEILWTQSWTRARSALSAMRVMVVEEQMVNEMNRCIDTPKGVVRVPFPLADSPPAPRQGALKTMGILGGVRREQGLRYIDQTIDTINSFGYDVVLQDVKGVLSDKVRSKQVKWVGFTDQFSEVLSMCDAVLLHYDPVAYRFMGSGIMWEAAANGIPFLYTRGTAMSTMARRYGLGVSFSYLSKDSLRQAMSTYIQHRDDFQQSAKIVAQQLRSEHSLSLHLDHVFTPEEDAVTAS